mmetsp:Transcript_5168/g.15328  ORF Transcript_5168/g.15328 Transcript_5168/m.15328 type:complete len:82 (+) Transcript_5168:99-344(+)
MDAPGPAGSSDVAASKDTQTEQPQQEGKKRPKRLIADRGDRRVMTVFSGLGRDVHKDIIPDILRFRPNGLAHAEDRSATHE